MRVYNSLTNEKEEFRPLKSGNIGIYTCGVTVYDLCHIGHARSIIAFDVIYRYFEYKGYNVTFVRNFTDIDDKIINKANQLGVSYKEVSEKYINEYYVDIEKLNIKKPTYEPKATEHIKDMIDFVKVLIDKGYAYEVEGDVFFEVEKFKDYGKLSKKNIEDLLAGARIEVSEKKKNPLDFALWKKSKENEPYWNSPWGRGRPGWHLECSVMSMKYLGETFDIHGGGKDLIFPHHENEIAQSEAYSGKPFANYWLHNGFVNINKEKMSKSLGNFLTIRDFIKKVHPEILRFFLLTSHYRSPIDFSEDNIKNAANGYMRLNYSLEKLYSILKEVNPPLSKEINFKNLSKSQKKLYNKLNETKDLFLEAMDDDFNTAKAIGCIFDFLPELNKLIYTPNLNLNENLLILLLNIKEFFQDVSKILGLFSIAPEDFIKEEKEKFLKNKNLDEKYIIEKINERTRYRKEKNFEKADEIRDELKALGISLEDTPIKTIWKFEY